MASRTRAAAGDAVAKLRAWAAVEAGRLGLWTPVAIGAGAALYFALKSEPPVWFAPLLLAASAGAAIAFERVRTVARAATLIALGLAAADLRVAGVEAPAIAREMRPTEVVGRLLAVDEAPKMRRLILEAHSIAGVAKEALPERVRVSWRGKEFDALPGDLISLRAGLSPPPEPAAPGAFDYARQLYFQKIGGTGYAVTPPTVIPEAHPKLADRGRAVIERVRLTLTRRILEAAPGDGGAMVAASVTGKREAISEVAENALRDSGLAHLIAISGLNMALATGIIFFALRFVLAAIEPIALRYPIKKWSAAAALLSGFAYLLLSGGGWSAQRAFIMTSIFFVAILFDRRALSLRNVAIAAIIILLLTPEAVVHPGFQMSFAAVTALIAAYEWHVKRLDPDRSFSLTARMGRYVAGVAATDVIASAATAPYGLYHFNRAANWGLPANLLAIPIMGFWVMPAAILALFLVPFGLDGWAWRLSAMGVDAILFIGRTVSAWPGAVTTIHHWPAAALIILTIGGLWLCLMTAPWRLAGLAAIPVAIVIAISAPPPTLFVTTEGTNVGVVVRSSFPLHTAAWPTGGRKAVDGGRLPSPFGRGAGGEGSDASSAEPSPLSPLPMGEGNAVLASGERGRMRLAMFNPRKDKFVARVWKEYSAVDAAGSPTIPFAEIGRCDPAGCAVEMSGAIVAVSNDPLGLADDCARADLVVALYPATRRNRAECGATLIDRRDAWNHGGHAVWIGKNQTFRIKSVAGVRGARPWTRDARN